MALHQNLKYIHFLSNFFGVICIRFNSENNIPKFTRSRLGVFWFAFIWITYAVPKIFSFINKEVNPVSLFGPSIILLCSIISFSRQKWLIQALNELADVDKSQKNMRNLIGNKLTFYVSGIFMMTIIMGVIPGYLSYPDFTGDKLDILVEFLSTTIKLLGMSLFVTYLLLLRSRLQIVNRQLSNLTKTTQGLVLRQPRCFQVLQSNSNLIKLRKLRKLHSKLCYVCEKINKVFAFQLLVSIGILFVQFTGAAYWFIDTLVTVISKSHDWYGIISPILFTLATITSLTILCLVCTKTKNEVFRTGDILFEIKSKYEPAISKEIQRFSRQILHWDLKFTAFDFFDIDMTLIYEIITTATTYVTILMQYRQA